MRLTYDPPGADHPVAVAGQSERSQHQNRAQAWSMLRPDSIELELTEREAQTDAMNATKTDIGWRTRLDWG